MSDQTAELLLQEFRAFRDNEFRAFRDDVAAWRQDTGERLKSLETTAKDALIDNGQPSRLTVVEQKVSILERIMWIGSGVVLSAQVLFGVLLEWRPWKH